MRAFIVAAAILMMGLVGAQAECYTSLKEALTHGRSVRVKGECFYNVGKHTERKVVPSVPHKQSNTPESRPLSATGAAHALPVAWPKVQVKVPAWESDFQWMSGVQPRDRIAQVFVGIGF